MQGFRVGQLNGVIVFEVDANDPLVFNATCLQLIDEERHQGGLSASTDARDDFDELGVSKCAQLAQIVFSWNQFHLRRVLQRSWTKFQYNMGLHGWLALEPFSCFCLFQVGIQVVFGSGLRELGNEAAFRLQS